MLRDCLDYGSEEDTPGVKQDDTLYEAFSKLTNFCHSLKKLEAEQTHELRGLLKGVGDFIYAEKLHAAIQTERPMSESEESDSESNISVWGTP
jgi:hypothetical protein